MPDSRPASPASAAAPAPDRAALEGMIDAVLAALVANDPSSMPVTTDVSVVENYQPLALGQGIFATITGLGTYRHYFADPQTSQAGFIGVVRENEVPALLDIRLKVRGDRISELETVIIRDPLAGLRYEEMGNPEDVWLEAVPPEARVSRQTLIASTDKYFQSMQRNDGKGDYSFFDKDCNRIEHALQTTNVRKPTAYGHSEDTEFSSMTPEQQWKTGFLGFVTEIRDRRFVVVDEERQTVFAFASFDHNGTIRQIDLTTGKVFVLPPYFDVPRTLQVMEAFKLKGDKLYRIEMTLVELPYGTPPVRMAPPPCTATTAQPADRATLQIHMDRLLAALKAHDPSVLRLAASVRYTEDGQVLAIGDGLWGTLTDYAGSGGPPTGPLQAPQYRVDMAETDAGEALFLGGVAEESTPGMMSLRLKLVGNEIVEIEAVVIRKEELGERGGTVTLFQSRLINQFDEAPFAATDPALLGGSPGDRLTMSAIADRYFDALERGSSAEVPFASGCSRRDNGAPTSGDHEAAPLDPAVPAYRPYAMACAEQIDSGYYRRISKVRERRHWVDAEKGLVLSVAAFDNPARIKSIDVPGVGTVALPGSRKPAAEGAKAGEVDQLFGNRGGANLVVPITELVVQLTRIEAGEITRIEALSRGGPFGLTTGWPS